MKARGIPIFWCLSAKSQADLMRYYFDNYKTRLEIPPMPAEPEPVIPVSVNMTLEEIGVFMSQTRKDF